MTASTTAGRLPALIEAAAAVVGASDLEQVLRSLVSEARSATGAAYAALGVLGEHGVLREFIYEGMTPEQVTSIGALPSGLGVLGLVIRENRVIRLDSISDHPESIGFPPHHPPMRSFLGVPVVAGASPFGNLYLTEKEGGFTDDDVIFAEALSRIAGSAVTRVRLHERLRSIALVEDRERIARDLHDTVIQDLFAVGLGIQNIAELVADPNAAAALDDAVDRLDGAVERLRSYIFELRTNRGRRQLDERLQELVSRMGSAYPTRVTLDIDIGQLQDEPIEDEVVKIVSEALSNALRHAAATRIEVGVAVKGDWCVVVVEDDGRGFDRGQVTTGMGLANLEARTARLGGTVDIESTPGVGTRVEARLPLS
jgi:signal transduction histidine kinase